MEAAATDGATPGQQRLRQSKGREDREGEKQRRDDGDTKGPEVLIVFAAKWPDATLKTTQVWL